MSNEKDIKQHMIDFIEQKEREVPEDKMQDNKIKAEIVNAILKELERVVKNEDN